MIIDIHQHPDYHGYNVDKIIADMDKNGIAIACLLSWEAPADECTPNAKSMASPFSDVPYPFERCVAYKEKAPDRFLLGYAPDIRKPDSIHRLKAAIDLFDISICGEYKLRTMYDSPDAIRLYRFCGENDLPVLFHFEYPCGNNQNAVWPDYWYGGDIDTFERILKLCPQTKFLGHAPGFWVHISDDEEYKTGLYPKGKVIPNGKIEQLLEKYPNLYCDISAGSGHNALNRDHEFSVKFLTKWQDRVLYARDAFNNIHMELIEQLNLPDEVKKKIYEDNARKVLRGGDRIPKK